MKQTIRLNAIIFFQLILQFSFAQTNELQFHKIEGPAGKPIGKIRNITQDPHGYMWFSGEGADCIYRYDGTKITTYKHDESNPNSLGGMFINSVFADYDGTIWIGMNEGLDHYNPATGIFKHYRHNPNDPKSISGGVTPIIRDKQGRLWIGTDGLDLFDDKTETFTHFKSEPNNPKSLSSNVLWNLYEDRQGTIWVATGMPFDDEKYPEKGGLNRMEKDGTFTRFKHDPLDANTLISNKVRAMFEDSKGNFWVGTKGDGLHTMDRKTGKFTRQTYDPKRPDKLSRPSLKKEPSIFNNDQVTFIHEDTLGAIWIGTMWSGINRYDTVTKKITHYEASNGFPDESGWNIFQSRDGVLWISTQQNNLYRVDPFYKPINSVSLPHTPWCFAEDEEYLWIGTDTGGLLKYNKEGKFIDQFKYAAPRSTVYYSANTILSMYYDKGDTLWLGTSDGPAYFIKSTKQFYFLGELVQYEPDHPHNVPKVLKDRNGNLWFVINGHGVFFYNPKTKASKQFQHDKNDTTSLTSNAVVSILEDKSGTIWVSDYIGGVNRLDAGKAQFKRYLESISCHRMLEDSNGDIWLGTSSGLFRYDQSADQFIRYFEKESTLNTINIIEIVEDDQRNLWLHNISHLIKLNVQTKEAFIYDQRFGLRENTLIPLGFFKSRSGQFYLNHEKGYFKFRPEEISFSVNPISIIPTDITINNLPIKMVIPELIGKTIEETQHLQLKHNQNNLSISFAAIDYRFPDGIKYYTRLDGYDSTWREAFEKKTASFYSLPIGEYTFRVKVYNPQGTTGEKKIFITILPPWWQTWWAITSYVLFFGISIWSTSKWRARNLQRQNRLLEDRVNERTEALNRSLNDLKSTQAQLIQSEKMASLGELTAGIAHEIQNPLNFVNNFSEVNKELLVEMKEEIEKGNLDEIKSIVRDVIENEEKIIHHGKRADGIVKGMLQHSRAGSGSKELTDINALCDEYLRLAYHGMRAKDKSFNAKFETDFDSSVPKLNIVPQDIGRVILNLINNAFYACNERLAQSNDSRYEPTVTVSTKNLGDKIEINVKDNGNGIPDAIKEKIFQPFFTTKPTGQGTGLGLSLAYDIVTKGHGGEMKVETKEGDGSEFIIHLPIKKET